MAPQETTSKMLKDTSKLFKTTANKSKPTKSNKVTCLWVCKLRLSSAGALPVSGHVNDPNEERRVQGIM